MKPAKKKILKKSAAKPARPQSTPPYPLLVIIILVLVGIGITFWKPLQSQPESTQETVKEITDIDSEDNPELGLAGFSSGSLLINDQEVTLRLLAPDRKKETILDFPCENGPVTAVRGTYQVIAVDTETQNVLNRLNLGLREFVIKPAETEQTGLFSKILTLQKKPTYQAFSLAFRKSCFDTQVYIFSYNDKTQSVVTVPFVRKDKTSSDFITVPKGTGIPQVDENGHVISSTFNEKTQWRDKVRYAFDLKTFSFKELEAYSQPN